MTLLLSRNQFADINDNHLIETHAFLNACKGVVSVVELLGNAFLPVKSDINGNIDKLNQIYDCDPIRYKYLNDLIASERQTLTASEFHVACDALLWLTRALAFIQIFLSLLVRDYETANKSENLSHYFHEAYEKSLQKHHNWFIQKLSHLCLYASPSRNTFLKHLSGSDAIDEITIFRDIKRYAFALNSNILAINAMFDELGIEN